MAAPRPQGVGEPGRKQEAQPCQSAIPGHGAGAGVGSLSVGISLFRKSRENSLEAVASLSVTFRRDPLSSQVSFAHLVGFSHLSSEETWGGSHAHFLHRPPVPKDVDV